MTAAAAPAAPPEAMETYLKASKQRLYQAKTGNRAGYVLQPGDKGIPVERFATGARLCRPLQGQGFRYL